MEPNAFLNRNSSLLAHGAVALMIALPLFGHLDEAPLHLWDESRNAINAMEMNQTGQLIVTTFDYKPEDWNTKPPMLIWLIALCQRLFGYNELAVRVPSALAAVATSFLLLRFSKRLLGDWLPGIIAVLILVTIPGYVAAHAARTGDYDALLTLFTTTAVLCLAAWVEKGTDPRWLYLTAASLAAAVLTKGVAGMLVLPAMGIYVLLRKKGLTLFSSRATYLSLLGFILVVGGYYGYREALQPGYLQHVAENELGGRYSNALEHHEGDIGTYYRYLVDWTLGLWKFLVIPAAIGVLIDRDIGRKRLAMLAALVVSTIFLVVSFGSTKLYWYLIPIYPFLALFCGLGLYSLLRFIAALPLPGMLRKTYLVALLVLLAIAYKPYKIILHHTIGGAYDKGDIAEHDVKTYLRDVIDGDRSLGRSVLCIDDIYPIFYYREVVKKKGPPLPHVRKERLDEGMLAITWQKSEQEYIESHYRYSITDTFNHVRIYQIHGRPHDSTGVPGTSLQ